jgi:hypothetical protein
VVLRIKSTKELRRRGRSGKGGNKRRQQKLHVSANIPKTIAIIATLMAKLRKECWKLHPYMNLKRFKDINKKNLPATYSSNQVESVRILRGGVNQYEHFYHF